MDISAIKNPNPGPNSNPHSHSPSFLLPNGFGEIEISDIEMITIQTVTYTSLKDLLPAMSPTQNSSWHEIPIKNPLVKHAALAYLQPMSTPPDVEDKGLLRMLGEKCLCGRANGLGCFAWLGDVVLSRVRDVFGGVCRNGCEIEDEDEDEDEDEEDDDEYVKVD